MAKQKDNSDLFKRLTQLFRSGPVVKRKVRSIDTRVAMPDTKSSAIGVFQKSTSPTYSFITANAYTLQERLARYNDFNEMEYSLASSTLIASSDGNFVEIGELAKRCEENPSYTFPVYSYSHETKTLVIAVGKQARKTRTDHAWKVTFDNGQTIVGSANHRLMRRDGSYCMIEDLRPGDAMMPFYCRNNEQGYRSIYTMNRSESKSGWQLEHRLVAEHVLGRKLEDNEVVHHVNFTRDDNRIENLQVMLDIDHQKLHRDNIEKLNAQKWSFENAEWIEKFQQKHSQRMLGKNPSAKGWITFEHIVNAAEKTNFSFSKICETLDVSQTLIDARLAEFGFSKFSTFVSAYKSNQRMLRSQFHVGINDLSLQKIHERVTENDTKDSLAFKLGCSVNVLNKFLMTRHNISWIDFRRSMGWKCLGLQSRGRAKKIFDPQNPEYQRVCNAYQHGMSLSRLVKETGLTHSKVMKHVHQAGFKNFKSWTEGYRNHKVVSIEYAGVMDLYDLTVDGYKNFATDTVISHNTAEINSALDIYADETVAQDEKGRSLHIYSNNPKIRQTLEDLFYNTLNVEFNMRPWTRNLPIRKNSVIPLLDGRNITIEQLAKEYVEGRENWVYSVQDSTHRMVPGKVAWCGLTRENSVLVRVWLDDGSYVDTTPDHEWVMRDGIRKRADELSTGESLMPFYRDVTSKKNGDWIDGYERVYDPSSNSFVYTHRAVASQICVDREAVEGRFVVHHVDFDKRNNNPENLREMSWKAHNDLHALHCSRVLHTPEIKRKSKASRDIWLSSQKHRDLAREQLKELQARGLMKTDWNEYNVSPLSKEHNIIRSKTMSDLWKDSRRRAEMSANMRIKFDDRCVDFVVEHVKAAGKYVSPAKIGQSLAADSDFLGHFYSINDGTKRDLTKSLKSASGIKSLLDHAGVKSYISLIEKRLPEIASMPWFQRAKRKSERLKYEKPKHMDFKRRNHKVVLVERLVETDDVYCMEVLGPNGEHDRHNFMTVGLNLKGEAHNVNSGICLQNCKYGDFFLLNDVSPEHGVINVIPIPINELEREEGYDREDPMAVRFRWVAQGNKILENWEVTHMRLMGNDMFLPYGASVLEGARRIWRQLVLIEDAMLVYRIVRSPERRVFYIDVGNANPDEIPLLMEQARSTLRSQQIIDKTTGRVDLRYNPLSVDEDYFIPVRGTDSGTRIDTLQGGQNTATVEDVQYIQRKLFAALKVPKAYLGYDEMLSSKATLAQEDIRFSRTISMIQRTIISELNKVAIIHLAANGWEGDDLLNFSLRLSNPSTVAQQQKLELYRTRFEIAGSVPEGLLSRMWIQKNIIGLSSEEILQIDRELLDDAASAQAREAAAAVGAGGGDAGGGAGAGGGGAPPPDMGSEPGAEAESPPPENAGPEEEENKELLTSGDDIGETGFKLSMKDDNAPIKAQNQLQRTLYNRNRRRTHGASKTHMPDFNKMTGNNDEINDPYDSDFFRGQTTNPLGESFRLVESEDVFEISRPVMSSDVYEMLKKMNARFGKNLVDRGNDLLTESSNVVEVENLDELDVFIHEEDNEKGDE